MSLRGAERRGNPLNGISRYEIATPPSSARNDKMFFVTSSLAMTWFLI